MEDMITQSTQPTEIKPARNRVRNVKMVMPNDEVEAPVQAKDLRGHADAEVIDRKDLEYQRKRGNELVRVKFINDETPGEVKCFAFKKYKGDPIRTYKLKDHGIYELPLMVAEHLSNDCKTPIYGAGKDEDGNPIEMVVGWKNRCHVESLEFSRSLFNEPKAPALRAGY